MVSDQKTAVDIIEMLVTLREATGVLERLADQGDNSSFMNLGKDIVRLLQALYGSSAQLQKEESRIKLPEAVKSILNSLRKLIRLCAADPLKCLSKIKYELQPMIEISSLHFGFWAMAFQDKEMEEKYCSEWVPKLALNHFIKESIRTGIYKYDVSIQITAKDHLDLTKQCVESLLNNIPENIRYELILLNHGSQDETQKYFESVGPTKQIDVLINGSIPAVASKAYEGKHILGISNDVLVMKNAIKNMLECIESDPQIGMVVPATSNVSNLQSLKTAFTTLEEVHVFAQENNLRNPLRDEQRIRLCNPISLMRATAHMEFLENMYQLNYFTDNVHSFPDDRLSLWLRRNGYKMYLAKDAYCYHYGSMTLRKEIKSEKIFYENGQKEFFRQFQVAPWGTGAFYDPILFEKLSLQEKGHIEILGINSGLGSNPLKIKESLKENVGNRDVKVTCCIQDKRYQEDLNGIADQVIIFQDYFRLLKEFSNQQFMYIIIDEGLDGRKDCSYIISAMMKHILPGGMLMVRFKNPTDKGLLRKRSQNFQIIGEWHCWKFEK